MILSLEIILIRSSMISMKSKGASGNPFLIPLPSLKNIEVDPLIRTSKIID